MSDATPADNVPSGSSRVTILKPDDVVVVDGEARKVDLSDFPAYFRAVQWYGDLKPPRGTIEYRPDLDGKVVPNTDFSDFAPYQVYVDRWVAAAPPQEKLAVPKTPDADIPWQPKAPPVQP